MPAPTEPCATRPAVARLAARSPSSAPGRRAPLPSPRSNRIAAGTIGNRPPREVEADAALLEMADDAARRVEAEGRAAREHDRVDFLDEVAGPQQIGLARAGSGAAHVDATNRAVGADHDGAAGRPATVRPVADADAGDIGDRVVRPGSPASCALRGHQRARESGCRAGVITSMNPRQRDT